MIVLILAYHAGPDMPEKICAANIVDDVSNKTVF